MVPKEHDYFHFTSLGRSHKNFIKCSKCLKNKFKQNLGNFYEEIFEVNIPNKTFFGDFGDIEVNSK